MSREVFRTAAWLHSARLRGYVRLLAAVNLAMLIWIIATSQSGVDRNGFLIGTDFLSFWTAGQMLHGGGNVYDLAAHTAAQRAFYGQSDGFVAFFYPPLFLPFCYPLGLLPYFPALAVWLAATGLACLAAVRLWFKQLGMAGPGLILALGFTPVITTISHGQTSFLVAALLGAGAILVRDRPWLAGALIGLAVFKPQFGLMIPIVLLLTGEWRAIAAAVISATLIALASTLVFGTQVWADWLAISAPARLAMESGAIGFGKMQSVFAGAMLIGTPTWLAYALQAALGALVAAALIRVSWRRQYSPGLAAAMLLGGLLATPFILDYDLVLLAFPLIYLAASGFRPWEKLIVAANFAAPVFARPLGVEAGIPIMPPLMILLFVLLIRREWEGALHPGVPNVQLLDRPEYGGR